MSHDIPPPSTINGATRLFAIVGDPIAQVRSPETFNPRIRAAGHNAVLVPLQVASADFDEIAPALIRARNLDGLIVTFPFKERMIRHVDAVELRARQVGAVNVVRRRPDGGWIGDMFDGVGLVGAVRSMKIDPAGLRIGLIGAGGAGSAIAFALAAAGAAALRIHDIDSMRADSLARRVGAAYPTTIVAAGACDLANLDLLVNATPVGMAPGDGTPIDISGLTSATAVVDIIPKPAITPLLAAARRAGSPHVGGAAMVVAQGDAILDFFGLAEPAKGRSDRPS